MMNLDIPHRPQATAWSRTGDLVVRHRLVVAYFIALLGWLPLLSNIGGAAPQDVTLYHEDADALIQGRMPYRDTLVEYPPYAIPIFLLPLLFGKINYLDSFRMLTVLCDMLIRGGLVFAGMQQTRSLRSLLPVVCYCAAAPFLWFFLFQRFDLCPALVCVAAMLLFCADKPGWSGLAMAIGMGVKVYPVIFVPPLLVLALRQGAARRFSAGLAAGLLPMLMLGFVFPWWRFVQFQGDRGLQCESLAASLIWGLKTLGLADASWVFVKRWYEVQGPLAFALLPWVRATFVIVMLCSLTAACLAATRLRKPAIGRLARLLLVPLLGFVAFNQVLSPQFMIWLLPLAALGTLEDKAGPVWGIALATALTPVIFPSWSGDYGTGLNLTETTVLVTRNLLLVAVWCSLVREDWQTYRCEKSEATNAAAGAVGPGFFRTGLKGNS